MVFKRYSKRKTFRRKRAARSIQGAWRKKRATNMKFGFTKTLNYKGIHYVKDKAQNSIQLIPNPGTNTFTGVFQFNLANLTNASAFGALWDSFKITGVKITWFPVAQVPTPLTATSASPQGSMQLFYKTDFTDTTPWPNYNSALGEDPKVTAFGDYKKSYYFKPRPRTVVQEDPSTLPVALVGAQTQRNDQLWLSTRTARDVKHLGLKYGVHNVPQGTAPAEMNVMATYYLAFKDRA